MSSNTEHARADRPAPTNPARDNDAWTDSVPGPAPRKSSSGTVLTRSTKDNDAWVDLVADRVQAILREEGLDLELLVFYDAITEVLHAVGFDGAPARYFANLPAPSDTAGPAPPAPPPGTGLPRTPCPSGGEGGSGVLGPRSRGTLPNDSGTEASAQPGE